MKRKSSGQGKTWRQFSQVMSGLKGPVFVQQNASCCRQRSTGIIGVENLNGVWGLMLQKMKTGSSVLDVSKCLLIGTIASDCVQ